MLIQKTGHGFSNGLPLDPVVWSIVISRNLEDSITSYACKDSFVVILKQSVHLRELLLHELVLEGTADLELQTFSSSGIEHRLLSDGIIREFYRFVDRGEVDQAVEDTNIVKTSSEDSLSINILAQVVSYKSEFGRLDTLESHSDVHNDGDKC